MPRNVFISFLGGSNYRECTYRNESFTSKPVRFIQEAILDMYKQQGWGSNDIAFIFLTKGAESVNWNNTTDKETGTLREGLENRLKRLNLDYKVYPIKDVPECTTKDEIFYLFQMIFEVLQEGDYVYFDITHGFRFLPLLAIVLGNYAKLLRNIEIKEICYGNYEARDKEKNIAPIVDLTSLSILQDWALAAASFLNEGNPEQLVKLGKDSVRPLFQNNTQSQQDARSLDRTIKCLRPAIDDFRTCRGISIIKSSNISKLKNNLNDLGSNPVKPLTNILYKIKDELEKFDDGENVNNGFAAAEWCYNNGLYQQSTTLLQETIITYFCIKFGYDWKNRQERVLVASAITTNTHNRAETERDHDLPPNNTEQIKLLSNEQSIQDIRALYKAISDLRNDFNHSGFRNNPMSSTTMIEKVGRYIESARENMLAQKLSPMTDTRIFINLSNHPHTSWGVEQTKAASEYGEIIDMPFPNVAADADEEDIAALAEQCVADIKQLAGAEPYVVHVMGEMTLTVAIIKRLQTSGIVCVASTTERIAQDLGNGQKTVSFKFNRFRIYE